MKNEKKKRFKLFDMNRDGKGVKKEEVTGPPNLKNFFKSFGRKFSKLLSLNLVMWGRIPMYILMLCLISYLLYNRGGIFSMIFASAASLLGNPVYIASNPLFSTASGTYLASGAFNSEGVFVAGSGSAATNMAIFGNSVSVPTYGLTFFIVTGAVLLFVLLTWGWQSVGSAYISRGLVRGDPVFTLSDYFHAIKKNFKQGFWLGLLDAFILLLLTFDFCYLYDYSTGVMSEILLFIIGGMILIYSVMRKYIYLMAITFDIKTTKIFKNALIFTVLGIKRNLLGSLGSVLLLAVNVFIGILCMSFNFIVPLILPLVYYMGASLYISTYSAYPVIDKYMIEPYRKSHPEPQDNEQNDE